MRTEIIGISGMINTTCTRAVKVAIFSVDGVVKVKVDLRKKRAEVEFDSAMAKVEKIKLAIEEEGFKTK